MKTSHYIYKSTKLIHVLLEYTERTPTQDGIINSINITGDFFVYPEESLDGLEASLIGTKLEKNLVRQKVQHWLRGSQVFGFDSESLTKAIMARLLKTGHNSCYWNMALDEVLMKSVRNNAANTPTLRLYGWDPPAVSIGYFQSMDHEVNVENCKKTGVDVVRRMTGGGAVLHDSELTYSFITRWYPQNILESYKMICDPIIICLVDLGFNKVRFSPLNDVIVDGKKVSGNAQTRKEGILLQHGTILLDVDPEKMFTVLKVSKEKIRDKVIHSVKERVMGVNRTFDEVSAALERAFSMKFAAKLLVDSITTQEISDSHKLIKEKYGMYDWNWRR